MSSRPRCWARVAFEGNKKVKDADLAAAVQSKAHGSLQRATVQADVNRIIEAYQRVGRDEVSVVPQIIDRGNDRVDLVFAITEGKKTTVRQISFVGNRAFGDRQLRAVIKTSATSMLSFLIGGDVYDPDRVDDDREQIRTYYRNHGYADATVREARAEFDPATKGFALTFMIDEGQPYRFGDISVASNVPGLDPDGVTPPADAEDRRDLRRQRARQDHRGARHRDGEAGLPLCACDAAYDAGRRGAARRRRLRDRRRPALLCRAHRDSRQQPRRATT